MPSAFAKAYVQLVPVAEGFNREAERSMRGFGRAARNAGGSSGEGFAASFGSTVKKAIAALGIGAAIKKSFDLAGELQQNLGGTEAVFGEYAAKLQKTAGEAYKNMGMSASEYMATANKMGSLFQGSGMEQVKALELTEAAMQRAADVASVMGLDTASAMESIAGAAKGNFTMMDNLGVAMNETTLQAYAMEKGMTKAEYAAISGAEKSELAIQMFMERTQQYAGNFARESEETLSGSIGAMKAVAEDLLGNLMLGADITPQMEALVQTAMAFLKNNALPMIGNIGKAMPALIRGLVTGITTLLPELVPVGIEIVQAIGTGIWEAGGELLNSAGDLIGRLTDRINNTDWNAVAESVGGKVIGVLTRLIDAAAEFTQSSLIPLVQALIANIPEFVKGIVSSILTNAPAILNTVLEIAFALVDGVFSVLGELIHNIPKTIENLIEIWKETDWGSIGRNIVDGIKKGLEEKWNSLIEKMKSLGNSILATTKRVLGIASPSKKFAELGKFSAEGFAEGIDGGEGVVEKAVGKMYSIATDGLNAGTLSAEPALAMRGTNLSASTGGSRDVISAIERMSADLERTLRLINQTVENKSTSFSVSGRKLFEEMQRQQKIAGPKLIGGRA